MSSSPRHLGNREVSSVGVSVDAVDSDSVVACGEAVVGCTGVACM